MQIDNSILELRNSDGLGIGSHRSSSSVGGNSTEKHWPSSWLLPIPDDPPPRLCLIALTTHPMRVVPPSSLMSWCQVNHNAAQALGAFHSHGGTLMSSCSNDSKRLGPLEIKNQAG